MDQQTVETTFYSLEDSTPEPSPQRRTSERHLTLLRVGALAIGEHRELCLIKNVSAGGMMIRAYSTISPGTRLTVELKQGQPVSGTAKWVKDDTVGVSFDGPVDVVSLIAPAQQSSKPRMPRVAVECMIGIREGAQVRRATMRNISQGGLCIESTSPLTVGAEVVVSVPGLAPAPAVVKWKEETSFGIGFNRVLALSDLVPWLQAQQAQQRRRAAG